MTQYCDDPVILNQWHPLSSFDEIVVGQMHSTVLLGCSISYQLTAQGSLSVWLCNDVNFSLPLKRAYGFLWTSLGTPPDEIFAVEELDETDRQNVATGVFGVNVSFGRAIENFLDMGHFPFVHTGILGEEPHTEVKEYDADVDYVFRVPHINCALLYKSSPGYEAEGRMDVIYMFLQPMGPEWTRAHTGMCVIDSKNSYQGIRYFQQVIFGQDKSILENQFPKRLPLDSRAETPIRADKSAIAYRRWLTKKGLTYGVIPAI